MSDEPKQTLPRIRTFAQDFEHDRKESGVTLPPGVSAPAPLPDETKQLQDTSVKITDATKKPPVVAVKSRVPAFHELSKSQVQDHTATQVVDEPHHAPQKREPLIKSDPAPKTVLVKNTKHVSESTRPASSYATASIITDTKKSDFNLFSHLSTTIRKWLKSITTKKVTAPKYTVIESERRKGVIQKATTKSGAIFTADNDTLQDEIRRRTLKQPHSKHSSPEITWSPNTEPGYALLDPSVEPTLVVTPTIPEPLPAPAPVVASLVEAPIVLEETAVTIPPPVFVEPTIAEPALPTPTPEDLPAAEPEPAAQEYELTTPEAHYRIRSIGDVTKLNTNILSVGVIGIIAAIIIVVILFRALFGFVFNQTPDLQIPPAVPLSAATNVTDVMLDTQNQEALIIALQQLHTDQGVTTEFRIVDSNGMPIPMQQLLPLLGLPNAGSLNRSITDAHILYTGNIRSIILDVNDATTAFGSLLSWEESMVRSLSALLNIPATSDPISVTDRIIGKSDVRLFKAGEREILVYGFINANTVLLTQDTAAFSTVLGSRP